MARNNGLLIGSTIAIAALIIAIIIGIVLYNRNRSTQTTTAAPTTTRAPTTAGPATTTFPPSMSTTVAPVTTAVPVTTTGAPTQETLTRPTAITDCGYKDMRRAWYDLSGNGIFNDYCRFVGDPPTFKCVRASDKSDQYYVPTLGNALSVDNVPHVNLAVGDTCYTPPLGSVPAGSSSDALVRPTAISDCGYSTRIRGWFNANDPTSSTRNDFCRFVGDNPTQFKCVRAVDKTDQYYTPPLGDALSISIFDPLTPTDVCFGK